MNLSKYVIYLVVILLCLFRVDYFIYVLNVLRVANSCMIKRFGRTIGIGRSLMSLDEVVFILTIRMHCQIIN